MARVHLVRHGEAAAAWGGGEADPGLSDLGREQARAAARTLVALAPALAPARAFTSPLRRCRETAAAFAAAGGPEPQVLPAVAEIPTPAGLALAERPAWLRRAFAGEWSEIEGGDYAAWRDGVVAAVAGAGTGAGDAVVFTHFVAINAAVSAALGSAGVDVCRPAHAAIVTLETDGRTLTLVDLGRQAQSAVL